MDNPLDNFQKLIEVLDTLLSPNGCDWDKKQTHQSLIPYLLEEVYEVIESIENKDMDGLKEELGDLMLHVLFQAKLANDRGFFSIGDSLKNISSKLVKRHPHIFSNSNEDDSQNLSWEQLKKEEKNRDSVLDGVPLSLPSLTRARRIQEKASSVGFDWDDIVPIWAKVKEEISELDEAISLAKKEKILDEMGDVLFSVVNLARFLDIDPESALRHTIRKFESRFKKVEKEIEQSGKNMKDSTLDEMDLIWNKVKKEE